MEAEQKSRSEAERIDQDLKSEDGRVLLKHVREALMKRVDSLAGDDPECRAYIKLLKDLGIKITLGRAAAERIIQRELREGANGER